MLPIDRTSKSALDANLVNGLTSDAPVIKASNDVVYNTIDELYNYALNLINSGSLTTYPPGQYNKLINGNLDVWQRGTAQITTASGTYFPDRFSVANSSVNASAIKIDQGSSAPPIGSKYYLRYRLSTTSALGVSVSRFFRYKMESIDAQKLINNQVTITFKIKSSINRSFSYSINVYGFTGADNGVNGSGLIAGDGDYAGNTVDLAANTWTTISKTFSMQNPLSGTGLASNGISIELWGRYTTNSAETDTEYQFSQIQLVPGSVALPFQPRSFAEELAMCQRYYWKTFDYAVAPAQNAGLNGALMYRVRVAGAATDGIHVRYPRRMRTSPTITFYNPQAANNKWRDYNLADSGTPTAQAGGDSGCFVDNPQVAGDAIGNILLLHMTTDAEL